ncbi:hypothetical protein TCAL_14289 [Tigriopus californicus]|uniref:C2 domain-containing protein n=1 Tax=Tigriopus californicus TaxID=6832 RepID=A0A553NEZ5_TIGCA|nr:uncharacterized protein LOC131889072 [Tigriopus californicus]TRY64022.1 hypothetical protein TCAL_14289 [Tigriopus californicus]
MALFDPIQAIGNKIWERERHRLEAWSERQVLMVNGLFNLIAAIVAAKSFEYLSWAGFGGVVTALAIGKQVLLRRLERLPRSWYSCTDIPLPDLIKESKTKVREMLSQLREPSREFEFDADKVRLFCLGDAKPSLNWLNHTIRTLWLNLRAQVKHVVLHELWPEIIQKKLANTPLHSLKLHDFHIGEHPVRVVDIKVEPHGEDDLVVDVELAYDGNANVSLTVSQSDLKISIPAKLQKLKISNLKLRIVVKKFLPCLPFIGGLQVSLLEEPLMDWETSGVVQITDIDMLKSIIKKLVGKHVFKKLQLPNRFTLPMSMIAGNSLKTMAADIGARYQTISALEVAMPQPMGVLRVTVHQADNLRLTDWSLINFSHHTNPFRPSRFAISEILPKRILGKCFVKVNLGGMSFSSEIKSSSSSPVWDYSCDFPIEYCTDDEITVDIWDKRLAKDLYLGRVTERIRRVFESPNRLLEGWYNCQVYQGRVWLKLEWFRQVRMLSLEEVRQPPSNRGLLSVVFGHLRYLPQVRTRKIRPQCFLRIRYDDEEDGVLLHEVASNESLSLKNKHVFNEGKIVRLHNLEKLYHHGVVELEVKDCSSGASVCFEALTFRGLIHSPLNGRDMLNLLLKGEQGLLRLSIQAEILRDVFGSPSPFDSVQSKCFDQ